MWPTQNVPQRPVDSPQGPYLPGPIFSESSPFRDGPPDGGEFARPLPFSVAAEETMTGRLMFGVGVNSDAGLVGSIVLDEQNFDWTRFPNSWEDIRNATAWRGAGQRFRLEAAPGTQVSRYSVTFEEPYLFNTPVALGLSGYYYTRIYNEYTEQRLGGRVSLGYQFSPDLSGTIAYRGAKINLSNPIDPLVPTDQYVNGHNVLLGELCDRDLALHGFQVSLTEDKRDNAFLATEGYLIQASFEEVLGTFQYPHAEIDLRKYFTLYERPDGSGRQVLSLAARAGYTGDDTPIYERYYAGGFSTIRGFQFRGASPTEIGPTTGTDRFHRRQLPDARLGRIHVPHHGRRHAPRGGVLRYGHGRADHQQLVEQVPRGARFRFADLRARHGPRADRAGLRLPGLLEPRRQERDVQLLYGLRAVNAVSGSVGSVGLAIFDLRDPVPTRRV